MEPERLVVPVRHQPNRSSYTPPFSDTFLVGSQFTVVLPSVLLLQLAALLRLFPLAGQSLSTSLVMSLGQSTGGARPKQTPVPSPLAQTTRAPTTPVILQTLISTDLCSRVVPLVLPTSTTSMT